MTGETLVASGVPFSTAVDDAKRKLALERSKLWKHRFGVLCSELKVLFAVVFVLGICGPLGVVFKLGEKSASDYSSLSPAGKFFESYMLGVLISLAVPVIIIFIYYALYAVLIKYFQEKIASIRAKWNPSVPNQKVSDHLGGDW